MRKYLFILSCLLFIPAGLFAQSLETDKSGISSGSVNNSAVIGESAENNALNMQIARAAASDITATDFSSLTAETSAMERRINSSVDYYTGTANVNIDLCAISSYGFQIPISVKYTASGIKADAYPSNVGLNWKLTGMGSITRAINGQPDETGFLDGHGALAANSNAADWKSSAINTKLDDKFDGEPDLYYFELPTGQSGMFVINYDKTIALLPYQDVKVEWINNSTYANSYFVITDAQGMRYSFGSTADSREQANNKDYERTKTYVSGWLLDNISFGGKQIAQYSYATSASYEKGFWNYLYRFEYKPATNAHKSLTTTPINVITTVYPKVLTSITWDLGKLEFDHGSADNTVRTGPYLRTIKVYGYNNEYLKTIHFDLGWFATTLDSIYETSGDLRRTICSFQYFDSPVSFPQRNTYAMDCWGYNTGASQMGPLYPAHMILGYNVPGMSREPVLGPTKYRSLQKVIYPNGGWTEFEYELHQGRYPTPNVQNEWNGSLKEAGGLRIKSITQYETVTDVGSKTQYIYQDPADTKKGGQIFTGYSPFVRIRKDSGTGSNRVVIYSVTKRPDYTVTDFTGASVVYNYIKEVLPNGAYNVYEFNGFDYYMDVKGQAALSTSSGIGVYSLDPQNKVPYSTRSFGRGTLSKMTQYDSAGTLVRMEAYTYSIPSNAQKASVYSYPLFAIDEESSSPKFYKGRYQWVSQPVVLTKKTVTGTDPYSSTNYSYLPTYDDLFPRTIETTDALWNYYRTTITYPQDYAIDITSLPKSAQTYGIGWLKANGIKSDPIETIKYRKNPDESVFNVVGGTLNLYNWSPVAQRCLLSETKSLLVNLPLGAAITPLSASGTTLVRDSRYDEYNPQTVEFNEKGNPTFTTYAGPNKRGTHTIYGHNGHVPIARVEGAINAVSDFYTSFEEETSNIAVYLGNRAKSGNYALNKNTSYTASANSIGGPHIISYWRWDGNDGTKWEEVKASTYGSHTILEPNHYVDEVRILCPGASMTTQVGKPGIGVISAVDERGRSIRYNYNTLGMLESIEDDGRIVEKYSYIDGSELYNLSVSMAGGSSGRGQISVSPTQVSRGGSATFTATPNPGYQFSKWQFSDGTNSLAPITTKSDIRTDLGGTASFTEILYGLSAVVGSGSSGRGQVSVSPAQVTIGGSATWSATANNGYAFDYWSFSDGTTATTATTTKTNISQNIAGTAYFKEVGAQSVNFYGTIMPRDGYWAVHIGCTPDIISYGDAKVSFTGYFFINPDQPNEDVVPVSGEAGEDGYILSNAPFDENGSVGKLSGTISISSTMYKVGTVSWH